MPKAIYTGRLTFLPDHPSFSFWRESDREEEEGADVHFRGGEIGEDFCRALHKGTSTAGLTVL